MSNGNQLSIAELEAKRNKQRTENMTWQEATFNALGQGLTFGYSDEIGAGAAALFTAPFSDQTLSEIYRREVDETRASLKAGREQHKALSFVAELAGGIPTGLGLYKAGYTVLKNAPRLAKMMGLGAVEGGIYGAGVAEEDPLGGATSGAAWGAGLAPPMAGVGHIAQRGVEKFVAPVFRSLKQTPKSEARRILQLALERDDMTPHRTRIEMEELGPKGMLADIQGGNVQGVGRAITGQPGRAKSIADELLHNRQIGQQQRLLESAGLPPDDVKSFRKMVYNMINDRATAAGPLYKKAYYEVAEDGRLVDRIVDVDTPRTFSILDPDGKTQKITTSMDEMLKIIPKKYITAARKAMTEDVNYFDELKRNFPNTAEGRAAAMAVFENPNTSSLRFYDYIARELGGGVGNALKKKKNDLARRLGDQKDHLLNILDSVSDDYRLARETFAGEREISKAAGYGNSLMHNKVDLDELDIALEVMSLSEKTAFRKGALRGIVEKIEEFAETGDFAKKLHITKRMRELLRHTFPDQESFDRFIKTSMAESRFSHTRANIKGGSPTQPRMAEAADFNKEITAGQALVSGHPVAIGMVALREIVGTDVSQDTMEALANMLFRDPKVPQSVVQRIAKHTTGIGPSIGIQTAVVAGEKMRED